MKQNFKALSLGATVFVMVFAISCKDKVVHYNEPKMDSKILTKQERETMAWELEEKYWEYVQNIDTVSYKNLWHNDFIGYPSFGNGISNKSKIAIWIPDLHKDPELKFNYKLHKKAVNAIEDVVVVFYDADEIWTNAENEVVRKETYKFTHTWGKENDIWVILGGMAAKKNQDNLSD